MTNVFKKINIPALLTLMLGLGIMSGSFAQRTALAGRFDTVPALQVAVPKSYAGRYLHVIYAVGRPAALTISPIPYLDIIRPQGKSQLVNAESVTFPTVEIEKTFGRGSYNMIVFAVSNSPTMNWVNVDVNPNPSEYRFVAVIQKSQIDAFVAQEGEGQVFPVNF